MLSIIRFREVDDQLASGLAAVAEFWRGREGNLGVDLVANIDEPSLWALVSRWQDVGSYRRAMSGHEAKLLLTPALLRAVDEPSAYLKPSELSGAEDRSRHPE
ncbi:MAG: antibiotic biosynthesis monooxygenase [Propionibacteriaceae bacterium]|nr:antibiotic biosynthesis monooxygenase [Propionibacteriaceae bacterium]